MTTEDRARPPPNLTPLMAPGPGGPPIEARHFRLIARLARQDFGLHLPPHKRDLVRARLLKRVRALGLPDWGSYCARLSGPGGGEERGEMLQALTTNVTRFFREEHHFDLLREAILPPLVARARAGGRVRLWSAGCSTGQEAYSLAFTILDLCPEAARLDLRVLASDVDPAVLLEAERGVYGAEEARAIPPAARRHLEPAGGGIAVGPAARALLSFRRLNLVGGWPFRGAFDAILCRNVAIYFDKPTQGRLWDRLAGVLPPGGCLLIGHSERLSGPAEPLFESLGVTAHRRREP